MGLDKGKVLIDIDNVRSQYFNLLMCHLKNVIVSNFFRNSFETHLRLCYRYQSFL